MNEPRPAPVPSCLRQKVTCMPTYLSPWLAVSPIPPRPLSDWSSDSRVSVGRCVWQHLPEVCRGIFVSECLVERGSAPCGQSDKPRILRLSPFLEGNGQCSANPSEPPVFVDHNLLNPGCRAVREEGLVNESQQVSDEMALCLGHVQPSGSVIEDVSQGELEG